MYRPTNLELPDYMKAECNKAIGNQRYTAHQYRFKATEKLNDWLTKNAGLHTGQGDNYYYVPGLGVYVAFDWVPQCWFVELDRMAYHN